MVTGWLKSLQCKSNAFDDVAASPKPKKHHLLPCSNSSQALRDVVFLFPKHPPLPKMPPDSPTQHHAPPKPKPKRAKPKPAKTTVRLPSPSPSPLRTSAAATAQFPTLTELPAGHSSRRVVEIIFGSSWSDRGGSANFPGRIEMLFRVHNPTRIVARFEEYRSAVRSRSSGGDARCAADGNEMMRFHCAPSLSSSAGDGIYDASVACCAVAVPSPGCDDSNEVGEGIRTFAGSGGAHESAGGGPGRRAMLVCRVIAGRVRCGSDPEPSGESACGSGKGELIVFDPRAVLPCFLIIYKI